MVPIVRIVISRCEILLLYISYVFIISYINEQISFIEGFITSLLNITFSYSHKDSHILIRIGVKILRHLCPSEMSYRVLIWWTQSENY